MLLLSLSLLFVSRVSTTPSVWSCPVIPMQMQPFGMNIGESCPSDSFVHYYSCCDDNPYQCCFHFETWAIVIFSIICFTSVVAALFFSGRLLLRQREYDN